MGVIKLPSGESFEFEGDKKNVSDGYHTFQELYDHRIILYITLCKACEEVWMSKSHSDGSMFEGMFVLGINKEQGKQITYHLPISYWRKCKHFAEVLEKAPQYDGHSSEDVLERLVNFITYSKNSKN